MAGQDCGFENNQLPNTSKISLLNYIPSASGDTRPIFNSTVINMVQ